MADLQEKMAGSFAYKFDGFCMSSHDNFFLVGVGSMTIAGDGTITGGHHFGLQRLAGSYAMSPGQYTIGGKLTMGNDGVGSTDGLLFKCIDGEGADSTVEFHVVLGGDIDHLWFVSKGGKVTSTGKPTSELTKFEAVRLKLPA